MSNLRDRRYAKLLNTALQKVSKRGVFPTFARQLKMLRRLLGKSKNGATLKPTKFQDGVAFPLEGFNKNLEEIAFDFNLLSDSHLFLYTQLVETATVLEERAENMKRLLQKTRDNLDRALLMSGSNFVDAIIISFLENEHVDLENTTAEIDSESGHVTLPKRAGSKRIIPEPIRSPLDMRTQNDDADLLKGSNFWSIFSDTLSGWQVVSRGNWLEFSFDLGDTYEINKVNFKSPDENMDVELRTSVDGINFTRPVPNKLISEGKASFIFERETVRYIEFRLEKPVADNQEGNVFSIDSIAFFTEGYTSSAILLTSEISTENNSNIKSCVIESEQETPSNTSIELEASGDNGPWRRVRGRVLDFTAQSVTNNSFSVEASDIEVQSHSPLVNTPVNISISSSPNIELGMNIVYGINSSLVFGSGPPLGEIDQGSMRLFREDSWGVSRQSEKTTLRNSNKIVAPVSSRSSLFRVIEDEEHIVSSATNTVTLNREILNSGPLVGGKDARIVRATGIVSSSGLQFTADIRVVDQGSTREVIIENGSVPEVADDFDRIHIQNIGEVKIVESDASNNTLKIDPNTDLSNLDDDLTSVVFRLMSRDLTPLVYDTNGRILTLTQNLTTGEKVLVTYSSPLDSSKENVIGGSVEVLSGIDSGRVAAPGVDYVLRSNSIEVLPAHTLPTDSQGEVPLVINYDYVREELNNTTYWTWARVPQGQEKRIVINDPVRPLENESVVWVDPTGRSRDMEGLTEMTLTPGLHKFTVLGRSAISESGTINSASALYQLINIQARNGGYLFKKENGYFERTTNQLEPMVPAGRFYLERQARQNDTQHFAYNGTNLFTNFRLDKPKDAIRLEPNNSSIRNNASYRLEYNYFHSEGVSSMRLRTTLNRDPGVESGKTPVLSRITIRFIG